MLEQIIGWTLIAISVYLIYRIARLETYKKRQD
jgi:hypothetical protein